ncbi:MAG: tetratricopeptide repeat protein [Bacteroidales bacterium]|nr:tetratricopeptide repeat protein [Bacteroidales bacterium]MBN2761950.1 tetratricopeptide repeat protein [Bacteroidales bacterium]
MKTATCIIAFSLVVLYPLIANGQTKDSVVVYMQQYNYEKAIRLIEKREADITDPELLYLKGDALKGLNKYNEAAACYKKLFDEDTSNIKLMVDLAECYKSLNLYKKAQQLYEKALQMNPANRYLLQQLANAFYMDDDYQKAARYYALSITNDTVYYLVRQLARCYDNNELIDSALLYYHKTLLLNPNDESSVSRLANLYINRKEFNKAIQMADSFLKIDSTGSKISRLSGYAHFLNKDYAVSAERFKYCLLQNDTSVFVIKFLGYSLFEMKQYGEAKDFLEKAFLQDSLNTDLCYTLGLSCDLSYYKKQAIEYLHKAIELITPSTSFLSRVYQDLATAYTGYYKYPEALDNYMKAYDLTPGDTLLLYKIGSHYDNWMKDYNMALHYYQKFMDTRPKERKGLAANTIDGMIVVSYYDFVERRMKEIREEMFWHEEKQEE